MRCLQSTLGMWGLCEQKYCHNPAREKGWKPTMYPYHTIKRRVNVCSTEWDSLIWSGILASQHVRFVTSSTSNYFGSVCYWTKAQGLIFFALCCLDSYTGRAKIRYRVYYILYIVYLLSAHLVYSSSDQKTQCHVRYIMHSAYSLQHIYNSWFQKV